MTVAITIITIFAYEYLKMVNLNVIMIISTKLVMYNFNSTFRRGKDAQRGHSKSFVPNNR